MAALSCGGGTTHNRPSDNAGAAGAAGATGFVAISCGAAHACALRDTGEISCWGGQFDDLYQAPHGKFTSVAAGDAAACGLRQDGSIECTGYLPAPAPSGKAVALTVGNVICALRDDGSVDCSAAVSLSGSFSSIDAGDGGDPICGIRPDQTLGCTPKPPFWDDAPGGTFEMVACSSQFCCAVSTASSIQCWGIPETSGERDAPSGEFVSVRAAAVEPCAARADGTLSCWGGWLKSAKEHASLPTEPFVDYCVGNAFGCGVRADGSIHCFGEAAIAAAPPPR
ncbi:MAG TPA: RCC1 domain-containing protein [Polyangiaceae bacterium]|nr:RCC1 domain-containing protein [Polyangiaceae bacterium]